MVDFDEPSIWAVASLTHKYRNSRSQYEIVALVCVATSRRSRLKLSLSPGLPVMFILEMVVSSAYAGRSGRKRLTFGQTSAPTIGAKARQGVSNRRHKSWSLGRRCALRDALYEAVHHPVNCGAHYGATRIHCGAAVSGAQLSTRSCRRIDISSTMGGRLMTDADQRGDAGSYRLGRACAPALGSWDGFKHTRTRHHR
jgi:hypothetical protein